MPQPDYDALAKQAGGVDYDSLASQSGGIADSPTSTVTRPTATISAVHPPDSMAGKVAQWASNVSHDLKYGTNLTGVGTILQKLGAHGLEVGNSPEVGEFMGSLPLGLMRTLKGNAEMQQPGKIMKGLGDSVAGGLQAATIPSAMMAPEATEEAVEAMSGKIPSIERASKSFQAVSQIAGSHPVSVSPALSDSLMQYQQLVDAGGSRSLAVSKFLNRLTDPTKGPLTYDEARLFQSNISELSADEAQRLKPVMKRQVGQIASNLGDTVENTAANAGVLDKFRSAMSEYSAAKTNQARIEVLKKWGIKTLAASALGGAGAAGAKAVYDAARK